MKTQVEIIKEILSEGRHDKSLFHAIFMAGGPGSGKNYIARKVLYPHGLRNLDSDEAFEHLGSKLGLDLGQMDQIDPEVIKYTRNRAKQIAALKQSLAVEGKNGIIINQTGSDVEKYMRMKKELERQGYRTHMVFVHTTDNTSRARNIERGKEGGRTVPEHIRKRLYDEVQGNKPIFRQLFGDDFHEIENPIHETHESYVRHLESVDKLFKHFLKETSILPNNLEVEQWKKR